MQTSDNRILIVSPDDETYFSIVNQLNNNKIETARVPSEYVLEAFHELPNYYSALMFDMNFREARMMLTAVDLQADFMFKPRIAYFTHQIDDSRVGSGFFQLEFPVIDTTKPISNDSLSKIV